MIYSKYEDIKFNFYKFINNFYFSFFRLTTTGGLGVHKLKLVFPISSNNIILITT